ncbi:MAG: sigma 54-interacting transcriptional regulator, partial [Candidatus Rokuibacteriota bacterium]
MCTPEAPPEPVTPDSLSFERLLADLSAQFVNLASAKVDQEIEQSLRKIVEAMNVDRSSLLEVSEDGKELITTHQWARDGLPRDPPRDVNEATSWYTRTLLRGETVAYSRMPEELPDEAGPEKAYCASTGLRSNLTIPLRVAGRPMAALAIGCFRRERVWPAEFIPRLRLLGEVFSNALVRRNQAMSVERALAEVRWLKGRLEEENRYLRKEIDATARARGGIVGESAAIKEVLARAAQVADTDATVLLLGETGTGKELMARTIHGASARRDRLMVQVNCAALPPTLIEAELFGRERGAYTGALARQVGRFEVADGSTIFLDEIGDLPLELQAKLLHVLERGEFERLGGPRTIRVDARVIAATNRDLAAM